MSKIKIYRGYIISAAILVVLTVIILATRPGEREFQRSAEETLEQTAKRSHLISYSRYWKLLETDIESRLIDLRAPGEFESGHLPGAINIPLDRILDKQYVKLFREEGITKVIYSDSSYKAARAWIMLYQLGFNDLVILETTGSLDELIKTGSGADPVMIYEDERKKFKFEPDTAVSDYFPAT